MNACGPSRIRSWIGGRWWEGANGGGIKAPSKPFSKLFQKSRVLLQAFPKKSLAVLWDFKGLQGFQTSFDAFQIFLLSRPFSAAFWTPPDRIPPPRLERVRRPA